MTRFPRAHSILSLVLLTGLFPAPALATECAASKSTDLPSELRALLNSEIDIDGSCGTVKPDAFMQVEENLPSAKFGATGYRSNYVSLPNGSRVRTSMYGDVDFHTAQGRKRVAADVGFNADPIVLENPTEVLVSGNGEQQIYSQEGKLLRKMSFKTDEDTIFSNKTQAILVGEKGKEKIISYLIGDDWGKKSQRLMIHDRQGQLLSTFEGGSMQSSQYGMGQAAHLNGSAFIPLEERIVEVGSNGKVVERISLQTTKEKFGITGETFFASKILKLDQNRLAVNLGYNDVVIFSADGTILNRLKGAGTVIAVVDGKLVTQKQNEFRMYGLENLDCLGKSAFKDSDSNYNDWINSSPIVKGKDLYLPGTAGDGALMSAIRVNSHYDQDVAKFGLEQLSELGFRTIEIHGQAAAQKWGKTALTETPLAKLNEAEKKYGFALLKKYGIKDVERNFELLKTYEAFPESTRKALSLSCFRSLAATAPNGAAGATALPELETQGAAYCEVLKKFPPSFGGPHRFLTFGSVEEYKVRLPLLSRINWSDERFATRVENLAKEAPADFDAHLETLYWFQKAGLQPLSYQPTQALKDFHAMGEEPFTKLLERYKASAARADDLPKYPEIPVLEKDKVVVNREAYIRGAKMMMAHPNLKLFLEQIDAADGNRAVIYKDIQHKIFTEAFNNRDIMHGMLITLQKYQEGMLTKADLGITD